MYAIATVQRITRTGGMGINSTAEPGKRADMRSGLRLMARASFFPKPPRPSLHCFALGIIQSPYVFVSAERNPVNAVGP